MSTVMEPKQAPAQDHDPASLLPRKLGRSRSMFDREILIRATKDSFLKLNPIGLLKNPVIFVVEVGAALTTLFLLLSLLRTGTMGIGFPLQIALWLWFTVLFAN